MALFKSSAKSDFRRHLGPYAERTVTRVVVTLRGDYDIANQARLSRTFLRAIAVGDTDLVVDLSRVTFMDASTVGAILHCRDSLRFQARTLKVRSASPCASHVLELCDFAELDSRQPSLEAANDAGP